MPPPPSAIDLSVHPSVLAALREDGRAAASFLEPDAAATTASPLSAWLIGVSFRDKASSVVRVVGVVRLTPGRTLSEDLGEFFYSFELLLRQQQRAASFSTLSLKHSLAD